MNRVDNQTVSLAPTVVGERTVEISDITGFSIGKFITITNIAENQYYIGEQIGIEVDGVVPLDTPLNFAFPAGSVVTNGTTNMAVNGVVTTQTFSLRAADPGLPVMFDITRMFLKVLCASPVSLNLFGDLAALLNGIVLRRYIAADDEYFNIFNVKTNLDIAGIMFDINLYAATNPQQGQDGFVSRLTFAGQDKIGTALRLGPGDDLELLIQDNLAGLVLFEIILEGHIN